MNLHLNMLICATAALSLAVGAAHGEGNALTQRVARVIVQSAHHRVNSGIRMLDTRDRRFQQFLRRYLLFPHKLGKSESVVLFVVFHGRANLLRKDAKPQRKDS